jgi:hypothetical protein
MVAGSTNGTSATTTGTDVEVPPGVELTMFSPNTPMSSTASHMIVIETPAHSARACSHADDVGRNGIPERKESESVDMVSPRYEIGDCEIQ